MKQIIDHYAIVAKKHYADGYYYVDGYKTLPTLKKRFQKIIERFKSVEHDTVYLVARSYDREIIKIYSEG